MTKRIVCCVFDSAIQAYGQPIFVRHQGEAMRAFTDEVKKTGGQENQLASHPEDFDLRLLALFDDETGEFIQLEEGIRVLTRGKDVVQS